MTEDENKIKVFGSDDDLKSLGELLSNETSRKIIKNLMEAEMYTNEIATKLDMRVSLVIHHLKKMEALGLLEITDKKIKRKGENHRFFKMNFDIFITLDNTKENINKKGILKRIFRDSVKFTVLVSVSIMSYFLTRGTGKSELIDLSKGEIPDPNTISPLILPLIIIIIGLLIFYFRKQKN